MVVFDLDVFAKVVDNYGDAGFSYRFARTYKQRHPESTVRLFIDIPAALNKLRVPDDHLMILDFTATPESVAPIVVECYGCDLPVHVLPLVKQQARLWINIEYLSAEAWTIDCHGKASPQNNSQAKKLFYMPSLQQGTGGVLTEFQAQGPITKNITFFTYARSMDELHKVFSEYSFLKFDTEATFVDQDAFDHVLATSAINFVRGEESFVRAILAGRPFIWQAYMQEGNYQLVKVAAFLAVFKPFFRDLQLFEVYAAIMRYWNGSSEPFLVDNWRVFHENLGSIERATKDCADFLRQHCSMSELFDQFITKNL